MKPTYKLNVSSAPVFAVKEGKKAFNWRTALKKALSSGKKSSPTLTAKSESWVTCACGNTCAVIPRNSMGCPIDGLLGDLGVNFYEAVKKGAWLKALDVLERIEKRSIEVLAVMDKLALINHDTESDLIAIAQKVAALNKQREKVLAKQTTAINAVRGKAIKMKINARAVGARW